MTTPRWLINEEYRQDLEFKESFPECNLKPDRNFLFWLTCRQENQYGMGANSCRARNAEHKAVLFANL